MWHRDFFFYMCCNRFVIKLVVVSTFQPYFSSISRFHTIQYNGCIFLFFTIVLSKFCYPVHCRSFDLWSESASRYSLCRFLLFWCYFWFHPSPRVSCHMRKGLEEEKERKSDLQGCKRWSIWVFVCYFERSPQTGFLLWQLTRDKLGFLKRLMLYSDWCFCCSCQSFIGTKHVCVFG